MVFKASLFSFPLGTMGKIYLVSEKYSLRNAHSSHQKISSDRQREDLVGVNLHLFKKGAGSTTVMYSRWRRRTCA